jgi:hypothetical protein
MERNKSMKRVIFFYIQLAAFLLLQSAHSAPLPQGDLQAGQSSAVESAAVAQGFFANRQCGNARLIHSESSVLAPRCGREDRKSRALASLLSDL